MKKIDLNLFNKNENTEIKKANDSLIISYNNEYSGITYEEVDNIFKGIQYNRDNYINIDLETDDKYSAKVRILFYCENAEKPSITVYYDIYPQIKTRIKLKLNIFDSYSRFLPILPGTGKGLLEGKPSDPSKLRKISIDIKSLKTENKAKAYIHSVFISEKEENIIATGPVLVDEFGQLTLHDWPGKIKSFKQLNFTLKKFREELEKQLPFPNRSRFGGCLDLKFGPTGYFRTEYDGKRFWIVDPDGHAFISCGICYGLRMGDFGWISGFEKFYKWLPDKDDKLYKDAWITADKIPEYVKRYGIENAHNKWLFNFHRANMIRIYTDEWWQAWMEINGRRLKAWGFNTIGIGVNNHEDERVDEFLKITKIPYAITLKNYPKTEKCIFRDMPDVFSKEFKQKSKIFAKQVIKYCDDPYLLGYFINNEPEWMSQQLNMTEYMLKTNVDYESKAVFVEFLKKRYMNDINLLNNSWGIEFFDFIDIYSCTENNNTKNVMMSLEKKVIPTYQPHEPNILPMFIEKKAYQGATGRVYPIPYTDRLTNKPIDKTYETINLENEYISVMVLPEIGGRIQIGRDKINGYDFIYNNTVIKPAMIGLAGPWVSGGIEFNWPQHHRPTTFMPVNYAFEENADGSKTVWVGEVEPFNRTEGVAGITVCPGKSYIKVKVRLHNRTPYPQTFMWWANLAVSVNEKYKIVFPPDVEYVCDHDRRAVISFPEMKGIFYTARQFDYGEGTDGSWFPDIVVPTSLMVMNGQSEFNFLSGYDFKKDAGIVHVANHHISPGKKLFTWGDGDFGKAWANNFTDSDGPYVELMTGVYTDNQPDFSWIQPYETKTFEQYWYPVKKIGVVKNATIDAAVSFEVENGNVSIGFNTTGVFKESTAILKYHEKLIYEQKIDISPEDPFIAKVKLPSEEIDERGLEVLLVSNDEKILVSYRPVKRGEKKPPVPRLPALSPEEIKTTEELYINGLHLEQYRHHTYDPKEYYLEALKRDNEDIRCNNAMGMIELRSGRFDAAEGYFRKAIERLKSRNDNPYDTEVYYNLGTVLKFTGRYDEAYKYFYKAVWHYNWRSAGYYALAEISARKGDLETALNEINISLATNTDSIKGRNLKTVILRKLGRTEEALEIAKETAKIDLIDVWSRCEIYSIYKKTRKTDEAARIIEELKVLVRNNAEYFIDVAIDYSNAGFYDDAINILSDADSTYPMLYYYMGYYFEQIGNADKALEYYKMAEQKPSDYCFPNRLESINVLKCAQNMNHIGAKAFYYLGNLYYEKFRYEEAIENWEKSRALDQSFVIVHRNLGVAYFDKRGDAVAAKASMEKAFSLDMNNSRIFYELQQLYKNTNVPIKDRLVLYDEYSSVVEERDDCYLEKVILYTQIGEYDKAVEMLKDRKFNIYEGGEGKLTRHHGWLHVMIGLEALEKGNVDEAITQFKEALVYPANYGEGRSYMAQEAHIYYFTGAAYEKKGDYEKAKEYYLKASTKNIFITEASYFAGLALRKLGKDNEACNVFYSMIEEGDRLIKNCDKYGYFGVGMPIPQPFEGNIRKLNTVAGALLKGIGNRGLGNEIEKKKAFGIVRELEPNNFKLHIFDNIVK